MNQVLIYIAMVSNLYGVDKDLLYKIVMVESQGGKYIYNKNVNGTGDHGITQINDVAIKEYNINREKLYINDFYAIESTALILTDLRRRFPRSWVCRYNVGPAPFNEIREQKCLTYLNKLKDIRVPTSL